MIEITVPGVPIAKKRPRFFIRRNPGRGKILGAQNIQQTEEGRFLFSVQQQYKKSPLESPIVLHAVFSMPIPKGTSRKKAALMESEWIRHTKKPDLDNLLKFVKDCLNGVVWKDDSQVWKVVARKEYSRTPQTMIHVEESKVSI